MPAMVVKLSILLLVFAALPHRAEAGFVKTWQLKEAAAAPVLVVGEVVSVQKGERAADGTLPWAAETLSMTAEIRVIRFFPDTAELIAGERIPVHFLAYGPSVTMFVNGYPPPLPRFESGQILIIPLRENRHPGLDAWQLTADSGAGLTIPARAQIADSKNPPAAARPFLDREIVNVLSKGTPEEVFSAAEYLNNQREDLTGELMPPLEAAAGDDRERWAEVAANLLAAGGIPRPSVADFLEAKAKLKDWPGREGLFLALTPLHKLKASPATDALLIKIWIAEAPLHAWGSANSLLDYGDNPNTTETLRQALRDDLAGTSYIAWTLARNGHKATLPEALIRALKVVDRPGSDLTDLQGAAALISDYGADDQLKQLAALVRKYQTQDREFYRRCGNMPPMRPPRAWLRCWPWCCATEASHGVKSAIAISRSARWSARQARISAQEAAPGKSAIKRYRGHWHGSRHKAIRRFDASYGNEPKKSISRRRDSISWRSS
jgi:hypothetical protein